MTTRKLRPYSLLAVLTGLNLFNYLDRAVLSAVQKPLADEFHINFEKSGATVTAFMIGYFVTSPIFGYLGDRAGRKWLIAAGIFVWSLGTVLTGFAGSFAMLLAYRVLVGVGEASYATISPSLISDTFAPARRNNMLTIFYAAIPVGSALGYVFGGFMEKHFGWRHSFIWAGAPGLVLALVMLPFADPERGGADGETAAAAVHPKLGDYLGLFKDGKYQLVVWGYVANVFAMGAFAFWGPRFLNEVHGMDLAKADNFFGEVVVVGGFGGTMLGGFLATAWHKRNPAGYAWVLTLSVFVCAPLAYLALSVADTKEAMAFLAAAIFMLFLGSGPVNTLILESVPINLRASAMALSIFMIHLFGDMWSSQIVGKMADKWGSLQRAVLILPGALVVCAVLWLVLAVGMQREGKRILTTDGHG